MRKINIFNKAVSIIMTIAMCISLLTFSGFAADETVVLYEQTFDADDISDEITVSHNESAGSYCKTIDGAMVFGKTASGAAKAVIDMSSYIGSETDYTVSFDLKLATKESTVSLKLGACVAFRPTNDKYRVEWHNGSSWINTDATEYDFSAGKKVKFVVKNKESADLYVGGVLVCSDIPRRSQSDEYSFDKMILELAIALKGDVTIDNIKAYIPGADNEGDEPTVPDEPETNQVVYSQDFSDISDLSEEGIFTITQDSENNTYANIENGVLRVGKTGKGDGKFDGDFSSKLAGISNYLVSMDVTAAINKGYTVNIRLGGTVAIRASDDENYTIEWNNGSKWIKTDTTTYNLKRGATFRFLVKNQSTVDVYVGNRLVQAGIPRRWSQTFTTLGFDLGNAAIGYITLDNIVVTTDTTIEQLPEPEPEPEPDIENGVTTSDTPAVGAPDVAKEDFDLYLAIGQSNMAGRAPVEKQDRISIPNAYLLNAGDEWETAQAQYVDGKWCGFNRYSTVRKTAETQGINPAFYFAKTVAENVAGENKKIGIISNARGDTSIDAWQKGYTHSSKDYDLYEEAVRRAKIAMETGTLKGIIWHQGCANLATNPDEYIEKFKTLVSELRADLGIADLPIIIGEIPGFGGDASIISNRMRFNKNCISQLPSAVDNCWVVSSAGSRDIGDKTHFEAVSQRRLGTLYAEIALDKIYGITPATFNKVPLMVTSSSDGAVAADGVADIHSWGDDTSYWGGTAGSVWTADFVQPVTVEKIKSYFRNPYNYVAQYKIYLGNEGSWTLVADNSSATYYPYIDVNSAVIDDVENIVADSIKVEITGGVDIDEVGFAEVIGCHEFEVLTADDISATVVRFDGYAGNADISIADADTITVNASSPDGIKNVKIYFNGELTSTLTEVPYEIDIRGLGVSTTEICAVAESNSGKIGEAVLNLNITGKFLGATFEDCDFELAMNDCTVSGIEMNSKRGYVKVDTVDEEHGNSILVGMDTVDESYSTNNLPHINIPLGGIKDNFTFMCDMYVSAKDNSGDKKFELREKDGMNTTLAQFKENGTSGSVSFNYDEGVWYAIRFDIDVANGTYDLYIDGKRIAVGEKLKEGFATANYIRLYGQRYDNVKGYTAIDNIKVLKTYTYPSVISVGNDSIVDINAENFDIVLSCALNKSSVTTDNIILVDGNGERLTLKSVAWDSKLNKITVSPKRPLGSGGKYVVILDGDIQIEGGIKISTPLEVPFSTALSGVGIADVQFGTGYGVHTATVELYNATGKQQSVYAVMTVWNGKQFCGMQIEKVELTGAEHIVNMSVIAPKGITTEIYVYPSLSMPAYTGSYIYKN